MVSIVYVYILAILAGVDTTINNDTNTTSDTVDSSEMTMLPQSSLSSEGNTTVPAIPSTPISVLTNVTVQVGSHAFLPCYVRRLNNKPISWIRVEDGHIITVDQTTFINDLRFQSVFSGNPEKWSLQIKYVKASDRGLYECQISTEPKRSARVYLKVIVPKTEVIGDQIRFVKVGSKVSLHCIVRGSLDPPSYIMWFRGNQQIMEGDPRGWKVELDREIFGNNNDRQNTIGSLIIPFVTKKDTGNYTCIPSNSPPVNIYLYVLKNEYPASAVRSSGYIVDGDASILMVMLFYPVIILS